MPRMAIITLYIDPRQFREETGEQLTKARLEEYGRQVNEDAAGMYGYEAWATKFVNVPPRKSQ